MPLVSVTYLVRVFAVKRPVPCLKQRLRLIFADAMLRRSRTTGKRHPVARSGARERVGGGKGATCYHQRRAGGRGTPRGAERRQSRCAVEIRVPTRRRNKRASTVVDQRQRNSGRYSKGLHGDREDGRTKRGNGSHAQTHTHARAELRTENDRREGYESVGHFSARERTRTNTHVQEETHKTNNTTKRNENIYIYIY